MTNPAELPQLISEMADVSKQYLLTEAVDPVKRLGSFTGKSALAGVLFAIGTLLLVVALLRLVSETAPASELWQIGVKAAFAAGLLVVVGVTAKLVSR